MKILATSTARGGHIDLQNKINVNFTRIEEWFEKTLPGENYEKIKNEISSKIDNGKITDTILVHQWMKYISQKDSTSNFVPITQSLVYSILAEMACEEGDTAKGWSFIADACFRAGLSESYVLQEQIRLSVDKKKSDGAKGHAIKDKNNFQSVKKKVAELLRERSPVGGWTDIEAAINCILGDLKAYIARYKISLKPSYLPITLKKWLRQDPFFSPEFDALRAAKISKLVTPRSQTKR